MSRNTVNQQRSPTSSLSLSARSPRATYPAPPSTLAATKALSLPQTARGATTSMNNNTTFRARIAEQEAELALRREAEREHSMKQVFAQRATNAIQSQEQIMKIVSMLKNTSFAPKKSDVKKEKLKRQQAREERRREREAHRNTSVFGTSSLTSPRRPSASLYAISSDGGNTSGTRRGSRFTAGDQSSFIEERICDDGRGIGRSGIISPPFSDDEQQYGSDASDADSIDDEDDDDGEDSSGSSDLSSDMEDWAAGGLSSSAKMKKKAAKKKAKGSGSPKKKLKIIYGDDPDGVYEDVSTEGGSMTLAQHEKELLEQMAKHDEMDPAKMAHKYKQMYIPNPPKFTSSSISHSMENVVDDADEVILSTEQMLRYVTDPQQRMWRLGSLDGELARCKYHTQKCEIWVDNVLTHVPLYTAGSRTISHGAHDEVLMTRRQVVEDKEEMDLQDRHWARKRMENDTLAKRKEHLEMEIALKKYALSNEVGEFNHWKQGVVRLRQLLNQVKAQLLAVGLKNVQEKRAQRKAEKEETLRLGGNTDLTVSKVYDEEAASSNTDVLVMAMGQRKLLDLYEHVVKGAFDASQSDSMSASTKSTLDRLVSKEADAVSGSGGGVLNTSNLSEQPTVPGLAATMAPSPTVSQTSASADVAFVPKPPSIRRRNQPKTPTQ